MRCSSHAGYATAHSARSGLHTGTGDPVRHCLACVLACWSACSPSAAWYLLRDDHVAWRRCLLFCLQRRSPAARTASSCAAGQAVRHLRSERREGDVSLRAASSSALPPDLSHRPLAVRAGLKRSARTRAARVTGYDVDRYSCSPSCCRRRWRAGGGTKSLVFQSLADRRALVDVGRGGADVAGRRLGTSRRRRAPSSSRCRTTGATGRLGDVVQGIVSSSACWRSGAASSARSHTPSRSRCRFDLHTRRPLAARRRRASANEHDDNCTALRRSATEQRKLDAA